MSFISHLVAFLSGGIVTIGLAVALFYLILLRKIARNERIAAQRASDNKGSTKTGEESKDTRLSTTLSADEITHALQEEARKGLASESAQHNAPTSKKEERERKKREKELIKNEKQKEKEEAKQREKEQKEKEKEHKEKEQREKEEAKQREKEQRERELSMDPIHKMVQAKRGKRESKTIASSVLTEEFAKDMSRERGNSSPSPPRLQTNELSAPKISLPAGVQVLSPTPRDPALDENNVLKSGWIKMKGSLTVWWKRWMVVTPGKLLYYRTEKAEDLFGIILLDGCEIDVRTSKRSSAPGFKVHNPLGKSIFSTKGLKVDAIAASKMPGRTDTCHVKVSTSEELVEWIAVIKQAIGSSMTNPELVSENGSNDSQLPTQQVVSAIDPLDEFETASDITNVSSDTTGEEGEEGDSDEEQPFATSQEKKLDVEDSQDSRNVSEPELKETSLISNVSTVSGESVLKSNLLLEPREDLSNMNKRLSTQMEPISLTPSRRESNADISRTNGICSTQLLSAVIPEIPKGEEEKKLEGTEGVQRDSPRLSPSMNSTPTVSGEFPSRTASVSSVDSVVPEATRIVSAPPVEEQGWLELKTTKSWKAFFFLLRNGLLLYFDTEKVSVSGIGFLMEQSSDCDGLIDLDGCILSLGTDAKTLVITHSTKKPILFIVNHPSEVKDDKGKEARMQESKTFDTCSVTLRSDTEVQMQQWAKAIEAQLSLASAVPLILPRFSRTEGREEKCHWFNTFMRRYFKDLQHSEVVKFLAKRILARRFDRISKPDYIGALNIEHIDLGKEMITINEIFMEPTDNPNELIGEANIYYAGGASLTLSTEFYVNFPRHHFAVGTSAHDTLLTNIVPVNVHVEVKHLAGRVRIYGPAEIWSLFSLSFLELPDCEFDVQLKVGKDNKYDLSKIAKVSDFIVSNLKRILWKNTVMPNRITFALPLPGKKIQIRTAQLTSKRRQRTSDETTQSSPATPIPQPHQPAPTVNS